MSDLHIEACVPFEWLEVPAGEALIGAASDPALGAEGPATLVSLPDFLIARNPITNAQYAVFVRATGHRPPAHWRAPAPPAELGNHPVTHVDWHDARAFCEWAGVRLPTEAEWEKAARGTDARRYPWGQDRPTPAEANCGAWFGGTTEVGAFSAGASPYGVLDLSGNVWEWTASRDRPYPYRADDGREESATAGRRILRGGSFNHVPAAVRCAARSPLHADACDEYIGFRVALDGTGEHSVIPFDWVGVPDGAFLMGTEDATGSATTSHNWEAQEPPPGLGSPRHALEVAAFLIARTPVTNEQYAAYVDATGARPPGHWEGMSPPRELRNHPVTYVDWHEATAFCAWTGVRLPTEVEWEKAAAGTDGRAYPWGSEDPDPSRASFAGPAGLGTRPVAEWHLGGSPYGALDLAGNVWEWTSSLYRPYPFRPDDGREDPAAQGQRVLRGGSFRSPEALYLRCAFRSRSYPTRRRDHIGFRVVRSVSPERPFGGTE